MNNKVSATEKIKKITPDREKALSFVRNFSVDRWNRELGDFLGKSAEAMIALEKKEGKSHLDDA